MFAADYFWKLKNSNSLEQRIAVESVYFVFLFTGLEVPSQFDELGFIYFFCRRADNVIMHQPNIR